MTDDMREVFDKGLAQAFPDEGKPAESEWSCVADADDAAEAAAARAANEGNLPPPRAYAPGGRFSSEDIAAQQDMLDHWKAQGRLWGPIRYADVQSLLDEVKASRADVPNAEHATMAEAVAAVTSASLTLARIERKVDALGNPPREPANITPSWWVGADVDSIARAVAEMVHIGNVESVRASRTMLAVACAERVGMTLADVARTAESVKPVPSVADLSEDVERIAREVDIRAPFDLEDPDNTPAKRIRNVVAQLVERLRPVTPLPEPSANMLELGQRAAKVAFGDIIGSGDWWKAGVGHDAAHALTHDDAPALRPNERPGDEWSPANWIAFRDAVRRLPRKVYAPAETPAP